MTIDDVKLSEEGRFLPWGKVAAEKLQGMEDWIANGGGNPNSVQVIEGTLAEPWGDFDYETLFEALASNNASCRAYFDLTALSMTGLDSLLYADYGDSSQVFSSGASISAGSYLCYQVWWSKIDGGLGEFSAMLHGEYQDLSSYASAIPTTLTIIWHPLPETSESDS